MIVDIGTETVMFGLEGISYAVELSSEQAYEFRRKIAPFIESARYLGE
ncbi:Lsr2 dimerization domain-containing protein [Streptomyces djakartensis]